MSAHQMVCHLSDAFRAFVGRKPFRPAHTVFHRTVVKWMALYLPIPWVHGIRTSPEIDQEKGGTRPAAFAADVAELEAFVELVTAATRTFDWQVHPVFGPLTEGEWLRWGYLHMDHHLRQFGA